MHSLNIIGAGKVGKTLAYLFHKFELFRIQAILNRSVDSARLAQQFIGAGQVISSIFELNPANVFLITVSDDQISLIVEQLLKLDIFAANDLVFHSSGALSADIFLPLKTKFGVRIASVHPIKVFGDPHFDIHDFSGIYCGVEGDESAISELSLIYSKLGATILPLKAEDKLLYHAAMVFASNFVVGLLETSLQLLQHIGSDKLTAQQILRPIVNKLIVDKLATNSQSILTGPIARGDIEIIQAEIKKLTEWSPAAAKVYKIFGELLLAKIEPKDNLKALAELLK